jgi:hypothetical protein
MEDSQLGWTSVGEARHPEGPPVLDLELFSLYLRRLMLARDE